MLPTYLYGYTKRKAPSVSSLIRSVIAACLVGLFAGFVLGYAVFKMPEIPWFYYPITGALLATVLAGVFFLHLASGFVRKEKSLGRVLS